MPKFKLSLSQALSRAISAYNAAQFTEAERLCQQLIETKPDFFDALHLLAIVQSRQGKADTALAHHQQALKVQPDSVEALNNCGVILQKLKQFENALESFERALAIRPNDPDALYN